MSENSNFCIVSDCSKKAMKHSNYCREHEPPGGMGNLASDIAKAVARGMIGIIPKDETERERIRATD